MDRYGKRQTIWNVAIGNGGLYSRVPEYVNWKGRGKQYANEAKKKILKKYKITWITGRRIYNDNMGEEREKKNKEGKNTSEKYTHRRTRTHTYTYTLSHM